MNYLKYFESSTTDSIDVTEVDFTGSGDGIKALYIDGLLEFYGDSYHDDINAKILGFIKGLEWIKENYVYPLIIKKNKLKVPDGNPWIERTWDIAEPPPKNIKDIGI